MLLGETAELMCTAEMVCGPSAVRIVATLSSWIRIDEVRNTGGQVLKRELHVPEVNLATHGVRMPKPEATCRVRYSCVAVGGGPEGDQRTVLDEVGMGGDALGEPAQFVQGDRELLPCIEMAVLDMKVGEKARLYAPASWAFDAPGFPHAVNFAPQLRGQEVEVEVELVGMDNAADTNGMGIDLKMEVHVRRKEAGNRLFTKGALHEAVAKWELAAGTLPDGVSVIRYDLSRGGQRTEQQLADDLASCRKVQLSTQLNMANAQLKLGEPLLAFTGAVHASVEAARPPAPPRASLPVIGIGFGHPARSPTALSARLVLVSLACPFLHSGRQGAHHRRGQRQGPLSPSAGAACGQPPANRRGASTCRSDPRREARPHVARDPRRT